jgi:hypothetical protein
MATQTVPEAWVRIPTEEEMRASAPPGGAGVYQFGFIPAMSRLIAVHDQIGPAFGNLYMQIMFAPGHLSRKEREMVAGVAASAQDCHY